MIQLALPQRMTRDVAMMNRVLATAITVGWTGLASTLAGRRLCVTPRVGNVWFPL